MHLVIVTSEHKAEDRNWLKENQAILQAEFGTYIKFWSLNKALEAGIGVRTTPAILAVQDNLQGEYITLPVIRAIMADLYDREAAVIHDKQPQVLKIVMDNAVMEAQDALLNDMLERGAL